MHAHTLAVDLSFSNQFKVIFLSALTIDKQLALLKVYPLVLRLE